MTVTFSKQAFAILDRRDTASDGKIRFGDITSIDKDGKNGISDAEAEQAGLDPKLFKDDIQKLNQALKDYQGFDPSQVVFAGPTGRTREEVTRLSPGEFTPQEARELTRQGLRQEQGPLGQVGTVVVDATDWKHENALYTIDAHAATIQAVAQKYNLNPLVLGAILYDEIRHVKPVIEDITMAMGKAQTFGMAQLGNQELVRQGFFDKDLGSLIKQGAYDQDVQRLKQAGKIPAGVQPRSLTPTQLRKYLNPDQVLARFPQSLIQKGITELMDPYKNIERLGQQLDRIRREQGMPRSESLNTGSYKDEHQIARVVAFHNGRLDYPPKILENMRLDELKQAVAGAYPTPDASPPQNHPAMQNLQP